jgi:hypothetical protein
VTHRTNVKSRCVRNNRIGFLWDVVYPFIRHVVAAARKRDSLSQKRVVVNKLLFLKGAYTLRLGSGSTLYALSKCQALACPHKIEYHE